MLCGDYLEALQHYTDFMHQDFLHYSVQEEQTQGNDKGAKELINLIKRETLNMWKYINTVCQHQIGVIITNTELKMNGHFIRKGKQSQVESGVTKKQQMVTFDLWGSTDGCSATYLKV